MFAKPAVSNPLDALVARSMLTMHSGSFTKIANSSSVGRTAELFCAATTPSRHAAAASRLGQETIALYCE